MHLDAVDALGLLDLLGGSSGVGVERPVRSAVEAGRRVGDVVQLDALDAGVVRVPVVVDAARRRPCRPRGTRPARTVRCRPRVGVEVGVLERRRADHHPRPRRQLHRQRGVGAVEDEADVRRVDDLDRVDARQVGRQPGALDVLGPVDVGGDGRGVERPSPSVNVTPSRSVISNVRSSVKPHSVARPGSSSTSGVCQISRSYTGASQFWS